MTALVFWVCVLLPCEIPTSVSDAERRFLSHRDSLQRFDVAGKVERSGSITRGNLGDVTRFSFRVYHTPEKVRCDRFDSEGELVESGTVSGDREDSIIRSDNPTGRHVSIREFRISQRRADRPWAEETGITTSINPEAFGAVPLTVLNTSGKPYDMIIGNRSKGLTAIVNPPAPATLSMPEEGFHYVYRKPSGSEKHVVLDPAMNWQPVFVSIPVAGGVSSTKTEYQFIEGYGAFPISLEFKHYSASGDLLCREFTTIEVRSINEPIPDETFTLEGMGLRPQDTVRDYYGLDDRVTKSPKMTRNPIVSSPGTHKVPGFAVAGRSVAAWRLWAIGVSLSVFAVCCFFAVHAIRKK